MKLKIFYILLIISFTNLNASQKIIDSNNIFKNIRCLICQGQSVADSNSDFAQTIKLVVNDKIKEGKTEKEIYEFLIEKYGEWWWRLFEVFLSWSVMIARQGSSTVWMITCNKNLETDIKTDKFSGKINRTKLWVGEDKIATQQ